MILVNKIVGETPLELIDRLRLEKPELKSETLSYAGRLDPMAEGEMLILVGEENKEYEKYLGFDKEYVATFLIGTETDTGDILGLIKNSNEISVEEKDVKSTVEQFKDIKKQKYPWFSSKTVNGKKLFDHYKEGNFDIERPSREVEIYNSDLMGFNNSSNKNEIKEYILNSIKKVNGDFRQEETISNWEDYFGNLKDESLITFKVKLKVGTGTYIRALTEQFNFPVTLLNLNRTKIFIE